MAGPEAANNAGAGGAFIPLMTLGIPPNVVMALLLGAFIEAERRLDANVRTRLFNWRLDDRALTLGLDVQLAADAHVRRELIQGTVTEVFFIAARLRQALNPSRFAHIQCDAQRWFSVQAGGSTRSF